MRNKITLLITALSLIVLFAFNNKHNNTPLPIGSQLPHPAHEVTVIDGQITSFSKNKKANGLLIIFTSNTCPIVKQYETRIGEAVKNALAKNIGVLLLNPNEAARTKGESLSDMQNHAKKKQLYV